MISTLSLQPSQFSLTGRIKKNFEELGV